MSAEDDYTEIPSGLADPATHGLLLSFDTYEAMCAEIDRARAALAFLQGQFYQGEDVRVEQVLELAGLAWPGPVAKMRHAIADALREAIPGVAVYEHPGA